MSWGNLQYSKPGVQILFSLMIVLTAWLIFQLIAILSGALIFGVGFSDIQGVLNDMDDPSSIAYQKYLQTVISLGMFILAPITIALALSDNFRSYIKIDFYPGHTVTFLVILLMILALPMNNFFTYLNNLLDLSETMPRMQEYLVDMEMKAEQLFESFLNVSGLGPLLINLLVVAVVPAIGEELLFRGVLQDLFIRWTRNTFIGVLITSLAFALLHFQFLSVLPRFVLGMILGYIFVWTRSLWMPILAHFINNALAVIYYHYLYNGSIERGIENVGKPDHDPVYAALSLVIIGILLFVIRRMMRDKISPSRSAKLLED
jgi:hypothetical protein